MSLATFSETGIVICKDPMVAEFVALHCPGLEHFTDFGDWFVTVASLREGKLVAAAVFHKFIGFDVNLNLAAVSPRYVNRELFRTIAHCAFNELGVERITAVCSRKNKRSRKLIVGVGFKEEGVSRRGFNGKQDLCRYGMLRDECVWLQP